MTVSHINASSGAIVVVPASRLADDTVIESGDDSIVVVYVEGDASMKDAIALALSQRRHSHLNPVTDARG